MDSITMTFTKDVNKSLQINDVVYHQKNDGNYTEWNYNVSTGEIF